MVLLFTDSSPGIMMFWLDNDNNTIEVTDDFSNPGDSIWIERFNDGTALDASGHSPPVLCGYDALFTPAVFATALDRGYSLGMAGLVNNSDDVLRFGLATNLMETNNPIIGSIIDDEVKQYVINGILNKDILRGASMQLKLPIQGSLCTINLISAASDNNEGHAICDVLKLPFFGQADYVLAGVSCVAEDCVCLSEIWGMDAMNSLITGLNTNLKYSNNLEDNVIARADNLTVTCT